MNENLIKSPAETKMDTHIMRTNRSVNSAAGMIEFVDEYIKPTKEVMRKPSDQVLIMKELLKLPVVAQHFKNMLES